MKMRILSGVIVVAGAAVLGHLKVASTYAQGGEPVLARAKQERAAYLETLRALVSIESGSRDIQGLDRISDLIAMRLRALGGDVQLIAPGGSTRFDDTPPRIGRMVQARF